MRHYYDRFVAFAGRLLTVSLTAPTAVSPPAARLSPGGGSPLVGDCDT